MHHLIIGFCAAGANAAESLRRQDPEAEITILNGDSRHFYLRLDLEGVFEEKPLERLQPRPPYWWAERRIRVLNERALRVDVGRKQVFGQSGEVYRYDKLLIATGAQPRRLHVPGEQLPGIFTYHSLEDAQRIFAMKEQVKHAVIIGAGILGLEFARCAHEWFGWEVTLLVRGKYLGSGTVDASGSKYIERALGAAGVTVLFDEEVARFEADHPAVPPLPQDGERSAAGEWLARVVTQSGKVLETNFVAKCVGVEPTIGFLQGSPVLTDGKLIVNEYLEAPVPDVYAAGDVALVRLPEGRVVHCNTWNVALDEARTAAGNMLGKHTPWKEDVLYNLDALFTLPIAVIGAWDLRHKPGFDIHDLSTEMVHRQVVTKEGVLVAGVLMGDRHGDRRLRKLMAQRARVEGKLDRLFAEDATPEEFMTGVAV
ncbi:FAD-dependent oxidoreductase [candidate division KSB1 bacterium]|nr:FAD-dependent oxidoreductase [candidate division KSB1 bacterium]